MRFLLALGFASCLSFTQLAAAPNNLAKKLNDKDARHHSSSSSSKDEVAFASAFSDNDPTGQPINTINTLTPIHFPSNQPRTPNNISHPLSGDDTRFGIQESGTYLVGWTVSLMTTDFTIDDATIQLFNVSTATPIKPDPFQQQIAGTGRHTSASGQTAVYLPAGTILQLRIASNTGTLIVTDPTLFIIRVAD